MPNDTTGFNAFIFYIMTKSFYKNKNYNILDRKINKSIFLDQWNKKRANKDGHYFQKIENFLPRDRTKFIRFFSYYYLKNLNMYVKDMVDDEFRLYEFNEFQLRHVKEGVRTDFRCVLNFVNKNNITLKDVLRGEKLPPIFKLYDLGKISIHGLIVFNEMFDLMRYVKSDNFDILEQERYNIYSQVIFNKFKLIVNKYLFKKEYDWFKILEEI